MRGFSDVVDHDEYLFVTFCAQFDYADTIWWLGDMAFDGWLARLDRIMPMIPGVHHLILGNHDRAHPCNSRGHLFQDSFTPHFTSVSTMARVSHNGKGAMLSHFPYSGDHTESDRFAEYRPVDTGKLLIHGHTHSSERFSTSSLGTPQVNVGLEAWSLQPVLIQEVLETVERNTH